MKTARLHRYLLAILFAMLTACGGGTGIEPEPAPDDGPPPGPALCQARPEVCK